MKTGIIYVDTDSAYVNADNIDWNSIDMSKIMQGLKKSYAMQMKHNREKLGLSPAQVAVDLGVSQATIYNNENGSSCTRGLADYYKEKLNSLYGKED